jgi:hypothetical protein
MPSIGCKNCFSIVSGFFLCCLLAAFVQPGAAAAAETASPQMPPARFATVWRISGEVTATAGETGPTRILRQNDMIFVGERIRAGAAGEAVLKTEDAGVIAIRPQAEFFAEQFAAEGRPTDNFSLRLIKGGLRLVTGWIGRNNRAQYKISTITATIGVRGTDHEPYEVPDELAKAITVDAGTYDKVNRGGTTLAVGDNKLDIDSGKVGFAKAAPRVRTRGLFTIALPVLLAKVPDFYVPGQFDDEVDRLSQAADSEALRELERRSKASSSEPAGAVTPAAKPAAKSASPSAATVTPARPAVADACGAETIARTWLAEFDAAISRRDAQAIVRKFAPEVTVRVIARSANGERSTVEMNRDELARSTIAAVSGLTDYQQRRPSIEGRPLGNVKACDQIGVKSLVIEQGRQNGQPYRFESIEDFVLVRRDGQWLAIKAEATQR